MYSHLDKNELFMSIKYLYNLVPINYDDFRRIQVYIVYYCLLLLCKIFNSSGECTKCYDMNLGTQYQ